MSTPLRIGIAGLGTVGAGTLQLLKQNAAMIRERCGREVVVTAVSARDKNKNRGLDLSGIRWVANAQELVAPDVDVVVELIGGAEGAARELVEAALTNGKHVVTANKALVAHHAVALSSLAEKNKAVLAFEAAVAGGIPIIKALRDGLAANRFTRVAGILNGTCNYILTCMEEQQRSFDDVLKEAQALGYAEADPSFDIDGVDTAHKLAILAALAYGSAPAISEVSVEGIRRITLRDIAFARELGYRIKLLGIAAQTDKGILQRVHPCMVPLDSPLAGVHGVYNAVVVEGDAADRMFFEGRGAGAGPTASSVVADIMDIARGAAYAPMTLTSAQLRPFVASPMAELVCEYYLRLSVIDRPGVLAEVTGIFRDNAISLRSFIQHSHQPGEAVQLVLTTHATSEQAMLQATAAIGKLGSVQDSPYLIRIEAI